MTDLSNLEVVKPSKYGGNFTNDQVKGLEFLEDFVKPSNKNMIAALVGAAGTGKTYLLKYFLNEIYKRTSCVSAPTHKAVKVIEKATGKKGMTLHALHALRPNTDIANFNIANPNFDPMGNPKINNYTLIAIDESSQINKSIATLNERRAAAYNVKILYIGDESQLPPIKERMSETLSKGNIVRLTEVVRQKNDNPLLPLFDILREDIKNNTSNFISRISKTPLLLNDRKEGYAIVSADDFETLIHKKYSVNKTSNRFLAWKRDTVSDNNYAIRSLLNSSNDILTVDDTITGYNTVLDEFLKPIIINSIDYSIHSIHKTTNDYKLKVYVVEFKSEFGEIMPPVQVIDHRADTFTNYVNILNNLHNAAYTASYANRKSAWKAFYSFRDSILAMVDIPIKSSKFPVPKSFSYSYSLTIHKSQGSTYENVFLDLRDVLYYSNGNVVRDSRFAPHAVELRNKLLYVAFSRASKTVFIKY